MTSNRICSDMSQHYVGVTEEWWIKFPTARTAGSGY